MMNPRSAAGHAPVEALIPGDVITLGGASSARRVDGVHRTPDAVVVTFIGSGPLIFRRGTRVGVSVSSRRRG